MKVKGTKSWCLLDGCVKDNYYARFHLHSYHCCREMKFISRLDVNFPDSTQNIDKALEREMKVKSTGSRCLLEMCVKDNNYARFRPHSYHCCKEMKFFSKTRRKFYRLNANCGRTDGRTNGRTDGKLNPYMRKHGKLQ